MHCLLSEIRSFEDFCVYLHRVLMGTRHIDGSASSNHHLENIESHITTLERMRYGADVSIKVVEFVVNSEDA